MSSIVPNGQIRFLTQIPIDANYENSLDFLTEVEQRTYFLSQQPVHTMLGATRIRDGVIAVNCLADNLLSANYMMFQNTNFSNKWFYAFITNIEYINNNMCHVYYQIDDIQTWLFDVQLRQCFVEREHTQTDGMFEHLVDEGINTSEYTTLSETNRNYSDFCAILYTSSKTDSASPSYANCVIQNGILKGLTGYVFNLQDDDGNWLELREGYDDPETESETIDNTGNGLEKLNLWVYRLASALQKDSIVGIVIVPKAFVGSRSDVTINQLNAVIDAIGYSNFASNQSLSGGYTPKNKKLYNSPYCMIDIIVSDGQTVHLQPEFISSNEPSIELLSNISPSPSILALPKNYKGNEFAWDKALTYEAFPQASVSIDGYQAWVASGGLKMVHNSIASTLLNAPQSMIGGATYGSKMGGLGGATVGAIASGVGTALNIERDIIKLDVAKTLPMEVKGSVDATPITANKMFYIGCRQISLKGDVLKSIDDYFTMFGYKVNKLKQPSRRNRPHFTYLKTKGLHVDGGAPADAIQRIETIYDNGIRFWVNPAEVGDYSVNNAPV